MTRGSSIDFSRVWELGYPADTARIEFLPPQLREAEKKIPRPQFWATISEAAKEGKDGFNKALTEGLQRANEANNRREELKDRGAKFIVGWMKDGKVRAFAFEKPRSVKDLPVELTWKWVAQMRRPDWEKGRLEINGLNFIEVRFLPSNNVERLLHSGHENLENGCGKKEFPASKPVGRPSYRPFLEQALTAMKRDGELDPDASMKSHFPKIRQWLDRHCEEIDVTESRPGDEAIRRAAKPYFDDLKKHAKKL